MGGVLFGFPLNPKKGGGTLKKDATNYVPNSIEEPPRFQLGGFFFPFHLPRFLGVCPSFPGVLWGVVYNIYIYTYICVYRYVYIYIHIYIYPSSAHLPFFGGGFPTQIDHRNKLVPLF